MDTPAMLPEQAQALVLAFAQALLESDAADIRGVGEALALARGLVQGAAAGNDRSLELL